MDQPKEEPHVAPGEAQETKNASGDAAGGSSKWAPSTYGNAAGEKVKSTLGVVGGPVGSGLSTAAKPVGNIVESVVGGVSKAGEMATSSTGMGKEGDAAAKEDEEFAKKLGGKDQTGDNPLGL